MSGWALIYKLSGHIFLGFIMDNGFYYKKNLLHPSSSVLTKFQWSKFFILPLKIFLMVDGNKINWYLTQWIVKWVVWIFDNQSSHLLFNYLIPKLVKNLTFLKIYLSQTCYLSIGDCKKYLSILLRLVDFFRSTLKLEK